MDPGGARPSPCGSRSCGPKNFESGCFSQYFSEKNSANGGLIGKCWKIMLTNMQFFKLKSDFFFLRFFYVKISVFSQISWSQVFVCRIGRNLVCTLSWQQWLWLQERIQDLMYRFKDLKKWIRGARAPPPAGAGPADLKILKVVVLANIFLRKTVRMEVSSENVEKLCWRTCSFLN